MAQTITCDIVLIGGGIVGLWALNRLRKAGYSVLLLEQEALGAGQTIKSQGIIHGGIKYALTGFLNKSSQNIAAMPKRWQNCLQGQGEVDLRNVRILSEEQLLWSTGHLTSDLTAFFASKALKSRVQALNPKDYPLLLQHPAFKGKVYRLEEIVLDIPSLIKTLAQPYQSSLLKIDRDDSDDGYQIQPSGDSNDTIQSITVTSRKTNFNLVAKRYVFCAGEGNGVLLNKMQNKIQKLNKIQSKIQMQCRPLHMVLVKLPKAYAFYAHCLDQTINPRITITTHTTANGDCIWYLGGQIAEEGVHRTSEEQERIAKQELETLFPWISWDQCEFKSFIVNRAENAQEGKRPDSFFLQPFGNAFACWPTKLALTPLLCDELMIQLQQQGVSATEQLDISEGIWDTPPMAKPIWDVLFG